LTAFVHHSENLSINQLDTYIGSANGDWRSLSQVKELGIVIENCDLVAEDANKQFEMYWEAANMSELPEHWSHRFETEFDAKNPAQVTLNGQNADLFIASSPNSFCSEGRTHDIDSVLDAIHNSISSIKIEVMDYSASSLYGDPNYYWPVVR
jgi:phospholipase D3/4